MTPSHPGSSLRDEGLSLSKSHIEEMCRTYWNFGLQHLSLVGVAWDDADVKSQQQVRARMNAAVKAGGLNPPLLRLREALEAARSAAEEMTVRNTSKLQFIINRIDAALEIAPSLNSDAATDVLNMLLLCGEVGGIQKGESFAGYLRRLIDALPTLKSAEADRRLSLDFVRLGVKAGLLSAVAACGNHSEGCMEDAMTSAGLSKMDRKMLDAECRAADAIRKDISGTCEDSALGYAAYMLSEEDQAALAVLGVTSDWLYRKTTGEASRKELLDPVKPRDTEIQSSDGGVEKQS